MRYHLYTLFIILIISCTNGAYAAKARNLSISLYVQQDTLGSPKQPEKRTVEKGKKETLPQKTANILKNVPKAKNKAIPRTIVPTSINIKSPRITPVKVKVNTQVKIKL